MAKPTEQSIKKYTAQLKSAAQSLCAFLNSTGGFVFIGVKDDKSIVGQEISDKTKRDVAQIIEKFSPMPDIDIHYISVDGAKKTVIALNAITDISRW